MARKPETVFKERILPKLKALTGAWVCKIQQVSKVGDPDILMSLGGIFVAIELKSDEGKLSKLQEHKLQHIARTGGIAIVLEPENEEEVFDFLSVIAALGSKINGENFVLTKESMKCLKLASEP